MKIITRGIFSITGICLLIVILAAARFTRAKQQPVAETRTLLAVVAHPDDELLIGGCLAHYADSGVAVYVAVATDGALGITDFAGIPAGPQLAEVRRREMICSAEALHIRPPVFLNFPDQFQGGKGGLQEQLDSLRNTISGLFTRLKPDVVITFGAEGWTGHPDHRLVGNMVTEVFASRQWAGNPRLYYSALPTGTINDNSWAKYLTVDSSYLTVRVPLAGADYEKLRAAFNCHQSQYRESVRKRLPLFLEQTQKRVCMFRPFVKEEARVTLF